MRDALTLLSDPSQGLVREVRPPQIRMAENVARVLEAGGAYAVEAGVATGKTFAYMLPALLAARRRIVIATAKKQLQNQIMDKDIPALREAIGEDLPAVLVDNGGRPMILSTSRKGNGNYACRVLAQSHHPSPYYLQFLSDSPHGDRADYQGAVPRWWAEASAEDCVGGRCKEIDVCGFALMKKEMAESKIVVTNHHVLGMEMRFGMGKLLGGPYDVLIIDEAHKLAEGIRGAFTTQMSKKAVQLMHEQLAAMQPRFHFPMVTNLVMAWADLFESMPRALHREPRLLEAPVFSDSDASKEAFEALERAEEDVYGTLKAFGLGDNQKVPANIKNLGSDLQKDLSIMIRSRRRLQDLARGLGLAQGLVARKIGETDEAFENRRSKLINATAVYGSNEERFGFQLYCSPVRLDGIMGSFFAGVKTKVLTSATLAINGSFAHLEEMTGIKFDVTDVLASPFDYDAQGFVYVPRDAAQVPKGPRDASDEESRPYLDALKLRVDRAVRLVELSDGGAFVLTTANEELDAFARALKARFPGRTFAQGHRNNEWDGDPPAVLDKFRSVENSILVGSKSFWEGVDVVGGALRLVIVAKLPFPQVNDPIVKAREKLSANPFAEVQMADMLIDLRQGVGRLIRSRNDRGCVAILDNRVWTKRYGGTVLASLPWSRGLVTTDLAMCERYLPRFARHFAQKAV
jgi:ATP-dependent DNA helicase DinG